MVLPLWHQRNAVRYWDHKPCRVFQYGYAFLSCLSSCGNCWVHHVWVHEVFQRALHGCKHKHQQPQIQFCKRVTQYMQEKIEKAKLHRVISTGTMEHRFEVLCKDITGRGIHRDRVVQESLIAVDGKAFCTCMKSKLLHLPCSHLIAACAESGLQPGVFVFTLLQQGSSCIHLGTWGIRDWNSETFHSG